MTVSQPSGVRPLRPGRRESFEAGPHVGNPISATSIGPLSRRLKSPQGSSGTARPSQAGMGWGKSCPSLRAVSTVHASVVSMGEATPSDPVYGVLLNQPLSREGKALKSVYPPRLPHRHRPKHHGQEAESRNRDREPVRLFLWFWLVILHPASPAWEAIGCHESNAALPAQVKNLVLRRPVGHGLLPKKQGSRTIPGPGRGEEPCATPKKKRRDSKVQASDIECL